MNSYFEPNINGRSTNPNLEAEINTQLFNNILNPTQAEEYLNVIKYIFNFFKYSQLVNGEKLMILFLYALNH